MESKNEGEPKLVNEKDQSISLLEKPSITAKDDKSTKKILSNYYGLFYGLLSAICLSVSNVLIKKANFFSGSDTAALRYITQLIIMLLIALATKTNLLGPKEMRKILFLRGLFGTFGLLSLHFSIKFINPSDSTALLHLK